MKGIMGMFLIIASTVAQAQESSLAQPSAESTSAATLIQVPIEASKRKWKIRAELTASSNLYNSEDYKNSSANEYVLNPSYEITDSITAGMLSTYVHNTNQPDDSDFDHTILRLTHKELPIISKWLTLTPRVNGIIPTNEKKRKSTSLQGGIGFDSLLMLNLKPISIPATLIYFAGVSRNLHEYTRDNKSSPNTMYGFTNALIAVYEITDELAIESTNALVSGLTYTDNWRSKFELKQRVIYKVAANTEVSIGHVNGGNTLKSDYQTSNLEVFNENTSSVFAGLEVVF